jgi:hypothetical protein
MRSASSCTSREKPSFSCSRLETLAEAMYRLGRYDPPLPERSYAEYLDHLMTMLTESLRITREGGKLALVLDTVTNRHGGRHKMLPVVADVTRLAIDCGWDYLNDIAWCKGKVASNKPVFGSLGSCSAAQIG